MCQLGASDGFPAGPHSSSGSSTVKGDSKRRQLGITGDMVTATPTKSTAGYGDFGMVLGTSGLGFGDDEGAARHQPLI
jgi:hypothetical protein